MAPPRQSPSRSDRPKSTSRSCGTSGSGVAALYEQISALQNSLERSRNENIKLRMLLKAHCETKAINVNSRRFTFGDDPIFDYDQPCGLTYARGQAPEESPRELPGARPLYRRDYSLRTHDSVTPLCPVSGAVDSTVDAKLPTKRPLAQPRRSRPPTKCQHHVSFEIVADDEMCCVPSPKPIDIIFLRKKSTDVQPENPECASPDIQSENPEYKSLYVRPKHLDCTMTTGCF